MSAQQGRMAVDKVRTASQELSDRGKLVLVEMFQHRSDVFSQWVDHVLNVRPIQCQMENLLTPIVPVRFTTQVSGPFHSRDNTSDCATGQASDRTQITAGHRPTVAQQVEALVIRWAQPQTLCDCVVKQHHRGAVPARQPPDDFLDQFVLGAAGSFHQISLQFRLVSKLSTKIHVVKALSKRWMGPNPKAFYGIGRTAPSLRSAANSENFRADNA